MVTLDQDELKNYIVESIPNKSGNFFDGEGERDSFGVRATSDIGFLKAIFDEESIQFLFDNVKPFVLGKSNCNKKTDLPNGFTDVFERGKNAHYIASSFLVDGKRKKVSVYYGKSSLRTREEAITLLKIKTLRTVIKLLHEPRRTPKSIYQPPIKFFCFEDLVSYINTKTPKTKSNAYRSKQVRRTAAAIVEIAKYKNLDTRKMTVKAVVSLITPSDAQQYISSLKGIETERVIHEKSMAISKFFTTSDLWSLNEQITL